MTKAELIEAVADAAGVSKADAERTVGAFFDTVVSTTKGGGKVAWPGFGSFSTTNRPARTGRKPKTGEAVELSGKHVPHFKPGKEMRDRVNDSLHVEASGHI